MAKQKEMRWRAQCNKFATFSTKNTTPAAETQFKHSYSKPEHRTQSSATHRPTPPPFSLRPKTKDYSVFASLVGNLQCTNRQKGSSRGRTTGFPFRPLSLLVSGYHEPFLLELSGRGREANHSTPSTAEFKNGWICTPTSLVRLYGIDRDSSWRPTLQLRRYCGQMCFTFWRRNYFFFNFSTPCI